VDRRADIYAVGVMLWEGLTARPLWGDLDDAAIATRLAQGNVPPLQDGSLPDELRAICARALDVNPERRFPTALDFKESLLDYVEKKRISISRRQLAEFVEPLFAGERERIDRIVQTVLHPSDPSIRVTGLEKVHTAPNVPRRRRWKPAVAVGGLLLLGLTIFAAVSLRSSAHPVASGMAALPPVAVERPLPLSGELAEPLERVEPGPSALREEPPAAEPPPAHARRHPAKRAATSRRAAIDPPARPVAPTRSP
jgi:hypothetical protein